MLVQTQIEEVHAYDAHTACMCTRTDTNTHTNTTHTHTHTQQLQYDLEVSVFVILFDLCIWILISKGDSLF